ncbi:MAG: aromatic ring-hydroxylating dioxygenase subunit alpha [Gordonia sp. (in: high G+C Gram-positive bacteria)]
MVNDFLTRGGEFVGPPREWFLTDDWFTRDINVIFRPRWMLAGHLLELTATNTYITYRLADEEVLIRKDQHGNIRAYHNVCTHRGAQLCPSGSGKMGRRITCPYHSWTFDPSDGRLTSAPAMHESFDKSHWGLRSVHVEVWMGLIFVCLSENRPASLSTLFGDGFFGGYDLSRLKIAAKQSTIVEANWKVVVENDKECYHCQANHPQLVKVQDWKIAGTTEGQFDAVISDGRLGNLDVQTFGSPNTLNTVENRRVCKIPLPRTDHAPEPDAYAMGWFPGLTMGMARDYGKIMSPKPISASKTEVTVYWFVSEDAEEYRDYEVEGVKEFWGLTYAQDKEICENVQKGMAMRSYQPGPFNRLHQAGQAGFYARYVAEILTNNSDYGRSADYRSRAM